MEIQAILLARATALFEIASIDPYGTSDTLGAFKRLGELFSFASYPRKFEDLDLQKGIELACGTMGPVNIDKLTLFQHGIVVDTRSSTDDSEQVIVELLKFVRDAFRANVTVGRRMF